MPTSARRYSLDDVLLTIGGTRISGFGEGGVVEFEDLAPEFESSAGADGEVVYNKNLDYRTKVTVTLKETSVGYKVLSEKAVAQHKSVGPFADVPFLMRDANNGDEQRSRQAIFTKIPAPSKGKTAGDRVFELELPNGRHPDNRVYGGAITV